MFDQGPVSPHSTLMAYYRERLRQMHGGNLPSYLTANISRLSAAARAANLTLQDGPAAAAPKSLAMKRASPPSHSLGRLLMSLRATLSSITASSASTTSSSAASAGAAPAGATSSVELLPNSGMVLGRRPNLAMMAGGICGWRDQRGPPCSRKSYSFGMREQLYTNYHGAPGMEIELRVRDQGASMMNATFCFAPTGAGYGKRQVMVAVMGCIPVLISDHVVEPFEPFIDWPSISVRIKEADVTRAAEILMAVPEGRVRAMQSRLRCAARHMLYSSAYGAALWEDDGRFDAINTIVEILRMRLKHTGAKDADLTKVRPWCAGVPYRLNTVIGSFGGLTRQALSHCNGCNANS